MALNSTILLRKTSLVSPKPESLQYTEVAERVLAGFQSLVKGVAHESSKACDPTCVLGSQTSTLCSMQMEDEQKKKVQKLAERIQQAEYGLGTMRQSLQEAEEVNATLIKV